MFERIWVAYDGSEEASWPLELAVALARRTRGRLTLAHVAPVDDEPLDCRESLLFELFGLSAAARARQRLNSLAVRLSAQVQTDVQVATGPVAATLLELLDEHRPDLIVAGTRPGRLRWLRPRVARALAVAAPCPVLLVRPRPAGSTAAQRQHRAVLVAPRTSRNGRPLLGRVHMRPSALTAVKLPVRGQHSLLLQLFLANALVLLIATLALILSPVSVSRNPVVAEALVAGAGLAIMLGLHLVVLRRTLAPLRLLTDVMGTIDLRRPGRRLPEQDAAAEVAALARAFNAMLQRLEEERRNSARRALAAQEEERLRIAREMHDQIGQTLTAMTIQAERAVQMDGVDRATLEQIADTALQSLDDVRRIGRELRPEALDDLGLGNALITLCRRMSVSSGVRVTHALAPGLPALAPEAELVIYRIAQEAITNALRHAGGTLVHLSVSPSDDAVVMSVRDDGRGMPPALDRDTAGLSGMRERALLIGATLRLVSKPGEGTEVRLRVPLDEAAAR